MIIGHIIGFGDYQWKIIDIKDDRILILTDKIIEQRDFHDKKEDVTWEHSEIRNFLNQEFLERFNDSDRKRIVPTLNQNANNPWYASFGGNDTLDSVFLLSLDEVVRYYFGDSSRLLDHPKKNQRYWFDRKDENNIKRRAQFIDSPWWWWTRTPGKNNRVFTYVHGNGNIGIQGNGISKTTFKTLHYKTQSNKGGVRPALWLKN